MIQVDYVLSPGMFHQHHHLHHIHIPHDSFLFNHRLVDLSLTIPSPSSPDVADLLEILDRCPQLQRLSLRFFPRVAAPYSLRKVHFSAGIPKEDGAMLVHSELTSHFSKRCHCLLELSLDASSRLASLLERMMDEPEPIRRMLRCTANILRGRYHNISIWMFGPTTRRPNPRR